MKIIRMGLWCVALMIGIVSNCLAIPTTIPPASLAPTLNGLKISYFMKQNIIKVTTYVINNEAFPVICEMQYESGADKKHSVEQQIPPKKATSFSFDYAKESGSIILQLVCVKPDAESTTVAPSLDTVPAPVNETPEKQSTTPHSTVEEVEIPSPH